MGLLKRHPDDGAEKVKDSGSSGAEKDSGADYIEDVESRDSGAEAVDPALAKQVVRKFDRHLIPWLFLFWLLAFIDRTNIGNAKIDGLKEQAAPEGLQFNIALAIFYVPYICVDVPSNWVLKYFKAGRYLPFLITAWGIVSTCTGFVKNYQGLLAARFFLGLAEGGLLGGMILYLSMFYRRHQLLYRIGLFYCAAPLAGAFGGLLAAGLGSISVPGYNKWPWIFFVEGAITVVVGLISFFFLPHEPGQARFLNDAERHAIVTLLANDQLASKDAKPSPSGIKPDHFSWHWVQLALSNWNTQLLSLNFFLIITPIYSYSLFLPTIIKSLGYSSTITQLFSVPPNICGFFTVLFVSHLSDKYKMRGPFMLVGASVAIIGYILLIATGSKWVQYVGTFFVAIGVFPCSPLVMAWLSNNLHPHYVRATGTGYQIMVANMAAFIATFTYLDADAPRFIAGHAINLGVLAACLVTTSVLLMYQKGENRKRQQGARDDRLKEDEALLGHRHPGFRYTL